MASLYEWPDKERPRKATPQERRLVARVSQAIKHIPWEFGLQLDEVGWVPVADLVRSLKDIDAEWSALTIPTLVTFLQELEQHRFQIEGERIRARYGHSIPRRIPFPQAIPPEILFHSTTRECALRILDEGLRCVTARQYVHLAATKKFANSARKIKKCQPIVYRIRALEAHHTGVVFYETPTPAVWLADAVPRKFLDVETRSFREWVETERLQAGAIGTSHAQPPGTSFSPELGGA